MSIKKHTFLSEPLHIWKDQESCECVCNVNLNGPVQPETDVTDCPVNVTYQYQYCPVSDVSDSSGN